MVSGMNVLQKLIRWETLGVFCGSECKSLVAMMVCQCNQRFVIVSSKNPLNRKQVWGFEKINKMGLLALKYMCFAAAVWKAGNDSRTNRRYRRLYRGNDSLLVNTLITGFALRGSCIALLQYPIMAPLILNTLQD